MAFVRLVPTFPAVQITNETIRRRFQAHVLGTQEQVDAVRRCREALAEAAVAINETVPDGPDKANAMTLLDHARHCATAAIALHGVREA